VPKLKWAANTLRSDGAPGVVVGVVVQGRAYFWHEGTSGKDGLPLTKDTIFEIGSNTKTFTTTLLGLDVARGNKALTDPISKYLPGIPLQPGMQSATLGMLATFTAGLPELPTGVLSLPLERRGVQEYTVPDFLGFVSSWSPQGSLPAPDVYSNVSTGLLGLCLADRSVDAWMKRVRHEILDPLGMTDTIMWDEGADRDRTAQGFFKNGAHAPPWPVYAWAAAGALRSTATDLSKYLEAYLHQIPTSPDLAKGMDIASQPRFPMTGFPVTSQACAWIVRHVVVNGKPASLVLKNGGTAGFSSALGFSPDLGIGVIILTNRKDLPAMRVGQNLLERVADPSKGDDD
jgi:CubicO group peptidase (beta-lactamase class C family)